MSYRDATGDPKSALQTELLAQLREANSHLVVAALGARQLQGAAEAAQLRQEQFLSMLAHELRNPLAPLAMAGELLGQLAHAHPQLPKLAAIVTRQVAHMSHLVEDLLDASRISSGKISLNRVELDLAGVIDCALETARPLITRRHQRLALHLPTGPVMIGGDLVRLAQVFANLLINAAKFSPEFETISLDVLAQTTDQVAARAELNPALAALLAGGASRDGWVQVRVRDNGIGISAEVLPGIFDLFAQGFESPSRSQGGLGIGLALVQTIVTLHGGTVSAESAGLGLGSVFTVWLPGAAAGSAAGAVAGAAAGSAAGSAAGAAAGAAGGVSPLPSNPAANPANPATLASPASPASHQRQRSARILLVDDNTDSNTTLADLLTGLGHQVDAVEHGAAALARLAKTAYQIIICDIGLPGMDGFALAEAIWRLDFAQPPCLIALSGYNQPGNPARANQAGFHHYLTKPVASGKLQHLIATWLDQ